MGKIYWIGNHDNLESCLNQLLICCEILDKSLFFSGPLFCSLWTIFHREAWFIFIEGLGPYNHNLPLVSCYTFLQRVFMMFTHYSCLPCPHSSAFFLQGFIQKQLFSILVSLWHFNKRYRWVALFQGILISLV